MSEAIIGLVGRKRVGKDTVAARLVERHGFVRMAFADNLRRALLALDPIIDAEAIGEYEPMTFTRLSELVKVQGWECAKATPEVRRLLQHYGVAIREIQPDFWVAPVIFAAVLEERPVVITDVRFPNEADAVEKHGGRLIRIVRPGLDESDTHVSETALAGRATWLTLTNDGTVEDLHAVVDKALTSVPH